MTRQRHDGVAASSVGSRLPRTVRRACSNLQLGGINTARPPPPNLLVYPNKAVGGIALTTPNLDELAAMSSAALGWRKAGSGGRAVREGHSLATAALADGKLVDARPLGPALKTVLEAMLGEVATPMTLLDGARHVVVTLGSAGVVLASARPCQPPNGGLLNGSDNNSRGVLESPLGSSRWFALSTEHYPALPLERPRQAGGATVADCTGAGDCLVAGLVGGLALGWSARESTCLGLVSRRFRDRSHVVLELFVDACLAAEVIVILSRATTLRLLLCRSIITTIRVLLILVPAGPVVASGPIHTLWSYSHLVAVPPPVSLSYAHVFCADYTDSYALDRASWPTGRFRRHLETFLEPQITSAQRGQEVSFQPYQRATGRRKSIRGPLHSSSRAWYPWFTSPCARI